MKEFGNSVWFYIVSKKQLFTLVKLIHVKYVVTTLEGAGLRDYNIYLLFTRSIS